MFGSNYLSRHRRLDLGVLVAKKTSPCKLPTDLDMALGFLLDEVHRPGSGVEMPADLAMERQFGGGTRLISVESDIGYLFFQLLDLLFVFPMV